MQSNKESERDMDGFVDFYEVWEKLTLWQKARLYLHALIQYRMVGIIIIIGSTVGAAILAMLMFDNIYVSLIVGCASGVITASF